VTSLTATILFNLASIRCDTFQFQEKIRFGLWKIQIIKDGTCSSWDTTMVDAWVIGARVGSVVGQVSGGIIVVYLGFLFWSLSSTQHQPAAFLKQRTSSSLLSFTIIGFAIAIGMVGTISLASTIVRSDMCQGQCSVQFSGLYCAAILWVASGFSLLLVPLFAPFSSGEGSESAENPSSWKNVGKKRSGSVTSNEDHGIGSEENGFAIVKRFNNGETHITEMINEPDGTIRRTQIVKSPNGSEQVVAKIYDEDGSYVSASIDEEAAVVEAGEQPNRIADNENVVKILLSDSPGDVRPISTTIHWGIPSSHRVKPVTYFQEPPLEEEAPAPLTFSQSTSSHEILSFFPCQVQDILNERGDEDDNSIENSSIPSIIAFNRLPRIEDEHSSDDYGPRVLNKPSGRHDVV
jgi:hypothetical protein